MLSVNQRVFDMCKMHAKVGDYTLHMRETAFTIIRGSDND